MINSIEIHPDAIHIWQKILTPQLSTVQNYYNLLSESEKSTANLYRFEEDRTRYIVSRGALRTLLQHYISINTQDIELIENPQGKPFINPQQNKNDLQFNLSHSKNCILIAITMAADIGIDVEFQKEVKPEEVDIAFTKDELNLLNSLSDEAQQQALFNIWTRKEAVLKAVGKGFSISPSAVHVGLENTSIHLENKEWFIHPLIVADGYSAAVALDSDKVNLTLADISTVIGED